MARHYEGDVKRGDAPRVAPHDLIIDPNDNIGRFDWQGRTLADILANPPQSVENMVASFVAGHTATGCAQETPIGVRPVPGGRLRVHSGFNRAVAGILVVQRGLIPDHRTECKVQDINEKEALRSSVIENAQRTETSMVGNALAVRRLAAVGYTDEEILVMFGSEENPRSASWLRQLRKILLLSHDQQRLIEAKEFSARGAILLSEIPDPEVRQEVLEEAQKEAAGAPITEENVKKAVRNRNASPKPIRPSTVEMRDFWDKRRVAGNKPRVRRIADFALRFMLGEIGEKAFDAELNAL